MASTIPNCKDVHSTYFEELEEPPDRKWTKAELEEIKEKYAREQKVRYAKRQEEKFARLEEYALDEGNKKSYGARRKAWKEARERYAAASITENTRTKVKFDENKPYKIQMEGYSNKVNQALSTAAKNVAKAGSEYGVEYLQLVNLETGELGKLMTDGDPAAVGGKEFWDYVEENINNRFAFVHNHNTDGSFSVTDMMTVLTTVNVPMMVAVRNDGIIYAVEREGDIMTDIDYNGMYEKDIAALKRDLDAGIILPYERGFKWEITIVSNLIRDFMKGGKRHVFGKE